MLLTINGEPREAAEDIGLEDLMRSLGIEPKMIAVQHNDTIINRKDFGSVKLRDGDRLELIRIVGGG